MSKFAKAILTNEADRCLTDMKNETNKGFDDGSVTKNELLSWIVCEFQKTYFKKNLQKIRAGHFDEIAHLQNRIKRIKEAKKEGVELGSLEFKQKD